MKELIMKEIIKKIRIIAEMNCNSASSLMFYEPSVPQELKVTKQTKIDTK